MFFLRRFILGIFSAHTTVPHTGGGLAYWRCRVDILEIASAMGVMLVAGCGLIAFGPSLMLWLFVIGRRPVLVIIGIVSAFFWLASMVLASILWTIVPAAQNAWILVVVTGVALQGFGRQLLARLYIKTEKLINEAGSVDSTRGGVDDRHSRGGQGIGGTGNSEGGALPLDSHEHHSSSLKLNGVSSSIAAGVGWGAIHAVIMVGTALSKHFGPGAAFSESCPRVPSVVVSALSAQAFVWLDLLLMAAAFAAARSGNATLLYWSFASHYLAALTTGFNLAGGCAVSLPLLYAALIVSAAMLEFFSPLRGAMLRLRQ